MEIISPDPLSSDVAATPGSSSGLCDICSRINIESLSSPEGFPHFYKKTRNTCELCNRIFYNVFQGQNDDTHIRIKLSQRQSKMGLVTWFLRIEEENKASPQRQRYLHVKVGDSYLIIRDSQLTFHR
jgi:hypothetical protein